MAKFAIKYSDGSIEVVNQSDCHTVEAFINTKFGSANFKASVGFYEEPAAVEAPAAEEPVVEKSKPKAKPKAKK